MKPSIPQKQDRGMVDFLMQTVYNKMKQKTEMESQNKPLW